LRIFLLTSKIRKRGAGQGAHEMERIIKRERSIIPACDVNSPEMLEKLVEETCGVEGIGAYKVGLELAIPFGLKKVVEAVRKYTELPIIYDHQKAATDIPELGEKFVNACKSCGADAIIFFPQAGPATERAWIESAKKAGIGIIVGGEMTHANYLAKDSGFIADDAPKRIYEIAADLGVRDFVVPGNKPEKILEYKKLLEAKGIEPILYSPGLVAQGGKITESAKAAGKNWHAIVGRALYGAGDINAAAKEMTAALMR